MDWANIWEKGIYPLTVTLLILWAVGKFVTEYLWPLIKSVLENARIKGEQERLDRIAERDLFLKHMANRDQMFKETMTKVVRSLDRNTRILERRNHERPVVK